MKLFNTQTYLGRFCTIFVNLLAFFVVLGALLSPLIYVVRCITSPYIVAPLIFVYTLVLASALYALAWRD